MTPEAARYLEKARQCRADAILYRPLGPRIDKSVSEFLGRAYELKSFAYYDTGIEASISLATAAAAVEPAARFVDCITGLIDERETGPAAE